MMTGCSCLISAVEASDEFWGTETATVKCSCWADWGGATLLIIGPLLEIAIFGLVYEDEELFWLFSPILDAEDEDSVLAVVWLFAFTYGRGRLFFVLLAGTIAGSFPNWVGFDEAMMLRVFWVPNLVVLVPA